MKNESVNDPEARTGAGRGAPASDALGGGQGSPPVKIDDLRRQLRSLGYLDAGVDRFVLGPARETRRPAVIALLASLRIGLIAAVLLGPAAAVGIGSRVPGLVTDSRDAVVVAVYLGVLFGAAVTLAAFVASLLLLFAGGSFAVRRARAVSLSLGALVSAGCLAYLTLWWGTANAPGWSAPIWTAFALIVAVTISLLLGHAVTVMALAVLMARGSQPADTASMRAPALFSWKLSLGAGLLAFGGAAILLLLTAPVETRTVTPPLTVVSSGLRVRLIAIDGFDPGIFDALSAEGRIPALTTALGGARAKLAAEDTSDPARAWTTIATGQPPALHGVHGLETRRLAGVQGAVTGAPPSRVARALQAATDLVRLTRPAIASGEERRVKTLWEVAAESGLRTVVVNWWATWPAPVHSMATIVTDRAALRLERGGPLDAEIAPIDLYERLRGNWASIRGKAAARIPDVLSASAADSAVRDIIQRSAGLDALQLTLAEEVRGEAPDLLTVYLPGLDIAQHLLLGSSGAALTASAVAARVDALRGYYMFLDRLLTETVAAGSSDLVFVVAAPGRLSQPAAGRLAVVGKVVRAGTQLDARTIDVMPTVLYALGLPHSRELAGRPLTALFDDAFVARYAVREVATYGPPSGSTAPRSGQPLDEAMLERLRSLGYVR